MRRGTQLLVVASLCICAWVACSCAARAAEGLEYNRDIRPILAENCFACHGPDSAARKAKLRLDVRDEAVKAEAIVPGKPDDSAMIERIFAEDADERMPPAATRKKLSPEQKAKLKRWVAQGAQYQPHWSLIAPKRPPIPAVKNAAWVRNPIDNFILAELEKRGLQPAPEADRRALARRLSLDLTGLPPEPQEVEAFVKDQSADAYERFVDLLMRKPQWGEHRGRYWLDYARYADTHGIHFDNYREIWSYRDWVIQAFNANKPFDRFTIEQLAGDLLPNRTLDQEIASGFNRCNITTNEGGAIPEEYLVLYARERTETTSAVWLGLTANCAVCHDHKFDPIPQRDFYSMAAFFNNTTQGAMDGNIPNTPPVIVVPRRDDRPKWEAVTTQVNDLRAQLEARKKNSRPAFETWLASAKSDQITAQVPTAGLTLFAALDEGKGNDLTLVVDGEEREVTLDSGFEWVAGRGKGKAFALRPGPSVEVEDVGDFDRDEAFSVAAWVKTTRRGQTGSIVARMDPANKHRGWDLWVQGDRVGMHIINTWPTDAAKAVARTPLQPNQWTHVLASYDGSGKGAGIRIYVNGVLQPADVEADALKNTTRTNVPLKIGQRNIGDRLQAVVLQDIRVYDRSLTPAEAEQLAKAPRAADLVAKPSDKRTPKETDELFDWWLASLDQPYKELEAKLAAATQEEVNLRSRGTVAYVMAEQPKEPMAYVLYRGDYEKRRDAVKADVFKSLPPLPPELPHNRLGFAQWLLRPEHPLTARVTVNRFWQEVFGTGIVRTSGDFGVSGELPSHPELLDWLAVEFRESGWDIKRFFKLLVTSSTYRQAAIATKEKLDKDPQNRFLSRGPRFRMDAEMVRDYALAASGLLVPKIGGRSVKPYQPEGVWEAVAMIGSNTRDYRRDSGENLYRRSMYTFWKRSAPPASMEILNAPNRETCTVRRERTDTPLQALVTLNDPQFVEAARFLAQRALKEGGDTDAERFDFIAARLLARPLAEQEQRVVRGVLDDLLGFYKAHPDDAKKLIAVGESKADPALDVPTLAAWTMVANQMMNLDEVLNK
jgi:Protein of unknown function (DUF1553)/Protein of unknown function (DUF1549)/Concanavalin A-like lectin/glucanases superfamily/Planctomycete cytochrome C